MEDLKKYLISVEQTVAVAVAVIKGIKEKIAIVVDSGGRIQGIVTQADLNAWLVQNHEMETPIENVMNARPITFSINKSNDEILDYMLKNNIRQLPLVDENMVVRGIKCIDENDIAWITKTDSVKTRVLENLHWREARGKTYCFLGDGLTDFCEWAEFVHIHGIVLCNRGIFGNTISDVRKRLKSVLQLQPSKIFLMVGINDFIRGHSVDCIFDDYLALVMEIQKGTKLTRTSIYLQSVLPVQYRGLMRLGKKIQKFNEMICSWAKQNNIVYIDVYAALVREYEIPAEYTVDGWHLNAEGYKLWIKSIEKYF